ncbi:MAG: hypothetical protein ACI396_10675 [Acutalibacteraceae bacterium]
MKINEFIKSNTNDSQHILNAFSNLYMTEYFNAAQELSGDSDYAGICSDMLKNSALDEDHNFIPECDLQNPKVKLGCMLLAAHNLIEKSIDTMEKVDYESDEFADAYNDSQFACTVIAAMIKPIVELPNSTERTDADEG